MRFAKLLIIVLHSTLFYLFYLGATVLRIYLPPESIPGFLILGLVLILAFLAYPFITGLAFKFFNDLEEGKTPSWRGVLLLLRERYLPLFTVSAVVVGIYLFVAFAILLIFGDELLTYFRAIERSYDKFAIIWEAFLAYVILFLVALELPPVLFPVGIIVLLQPASEYFFAGAVASVAAVFLLTIPVLKCGLWLPHTLLGSYSSLRDSFKEAYDLATPAVMKKLLSSLLTSVGMAIALFVLLVGSLFVGLGLSGPLAPFLTLGRWNIPYVMFLFWGAFILFPGIVSLRFYRKRVSIYREALRHPTTQV